MILAGPDITRRGGLTTQAQRPGPRGRSIATATPPPGSLQRMVRPRRSHTQKSLCQNPLCSDQVKPPPRHFALELAKPGPIKLPKVCRIQNRTVCDSLRKSRSEKSQRSLRGLTPELSEVAVSAAPTTRQPRMNQAHETACARHFRSSDRVSPPSHGLQKLNLAIRYSPPSSATQSVPPQPVCAARSRIQKPPTAPRRFSFGVPFGHPSTEVLLFFRATSSA